MTMTATGLAYGHVASNWGDVAINAGLVEVLRLIGHPGITRVALIDPPESLRDRSLDSLGDAEQAVFRGRLPKTDPFRPTEDAMRLARYLAYPSQWIEDAGWHDLDTIIVNGGEHIFEDPDGHNWTALAWRVLPLVAARLLGLRYLVVPSTLGPVSTAYGDAALRLVTMGSNWATRDECSEVWVRERGQRSVGPLLDPAFFLPPLEPGGRSIRREKRLIGVVPRLEGYGMRPGPSRSRYVMARAKQQGFRNSRAFALAREVALACIERGDRVRILVQTTADDDLARELAADVRSVTSSDAVEVCAPGTLADYRHALAEVGVLVSARLHASILGWISGVPSVGFYDESHGHKMPGVYEALGIGHLCVRMSGDRPGREVLGWLDDARRAIGDLRAKIEELRGATLTWYKEALADFTTQVADDAPIRMIMIEHLLRRALDDLPEASRRAEARFHSQEMTRIHDELQGIRAAIEGRRAE